MNSITAPSIHQLLAIRMMVDEFVEDQLESGISKDSFSPTEQAFFALCIEETINDLSDLRTFFFNQWFFDDEDMIDDYDPEADSDWDEYHDSILDDQERADFAQDRDEYHADHIDSY